MRRTVPALLSLLLITSSAQAWNVATHEVVAAIAYDVLAKDDPKALAKVVALLKAHPLKDLIAKQTAALEAPAGQDAKASLMIAARFPDDVRMRAGIKGYHHPQWHYVDFPLSRKGDSTTGPQPEQPNALSALAGQIGVVQRGSPDADKAVALCWIAHLVGDIHQPLHAVSMYAKDLPKGDKGGNNTFVRFGTRATINLHSLWDGLLGKDAKFNAASAIATELQRRPEFSQAKLATEVADLDAAKWAKASFDLARKYAYLDATLPTGADKNGTVLPADYGTKAKAVAERQVVLAGYRLAAVLVKAVGE